MMLEEIMRQGLKKREAREKLDREGECRVRLEQGGQLVHRGLY